jgi:hypothetical protein
MFRRRLCALVALMAAGCAATPQPQPQPPPAPIRPVRRAGSPTLAERVRQEGWLTRFWEQLTPAQRRRVLGRMRRGDQPLATSDGEAGPAWDSLGLPDRNALVFGPGLSRTAAAEALTEQASSGPPE